MVRYVNLKSAGKIKTYIAAFKIGEISDLVTLSKNFFVLNPGEEYKLGFEIKVPPSAQTREYKGWTIVFRIPII